jgi:membrane protease YdiL (CAAX protease family)
MLPLAPLLSDQTPFFKLMILIMIIIISALFTMLLGILVLVPFYGTDIMHQLSVATSMADATDIAMMKFMQVLNQFGIFIIPAIIFAYLESRKIPQFLQLDKAPDFKSFVLTAMVVFTLLPFTHWLLSINENLHLPEFLSSLETWMKNSEESAARLTEAFLKTEHLSGLFVNILIVGVLAAVGEELLFRSVLIRLFGNWFKNIHLAVVVSALLFSAFHLQFYGFLPRLMLGLLFGYLFVWSGTVWLPIIAHFVNNASAVLVYYLYNTGKITTDAEGFGATDDWKVLLLSLIGSFILLSGIIYFERNKSQKPDNESVPEQF